MDLFNGFSAQGGDSRDQEANATSSWANPDVYSLDYILESGSGFGSSEVMGNAMALDAPAHYDPNGLIEADVQMSAEDLSVCYGMVRVLWSVSVRCPKRASDLSHSFTVARFK